MNKPYRFIKSRASGIVQVAPETTRARGKGKRLLMAAVLAGALASAAPTAWAANISWNAGTGDWFTAANWDANLVPSSSDFAIINNGGVAQVQSAGAAAVITYVGTTGTGTLALSNGGTMSDTYGYIGNNAGGSGAVTVDGAGSSWSNISWVAVGNYGSGALSVSNGGAVSNFNGYIGFGAGSSGAVTVDGAGSNWSNSNTLFVGNSGIGTLAISNGGAVSDTTGDIGANAGSSGAVAVDGTGSTWSNSSNLYVGIYGSGTLAISNGGAVSDTYGYIGRNAGSSGAVTVGGAGSNWSNSGALYVGNSGIGTLAISSGGAVSDAFGVIGANAGSGGAATVDGTGSSWSNSTALYVGNSGIGTLAIGNGGAVSDANGYIGLNTGSSGAVTVDGTGSSWSNSGVLFVGNSGSGTLAIGNGGAVSDISGYIGANAGSSGTVTVDGSSWSNSSDLFVGYSGSGTLAISNGGAVNVASGAGTVTLAQNSGSSGTLNIGDGGSAGILNAATVNGGAGTATLNLNHSDSAYYFTTDGTASGTGITISGSTAVNQIGSGTTVLTGANTYTGDTNIDAGKLIVNGSIAGDTFVNNGGTLGGSGTLGNVTVASGGTLSPGNSPGTLTVNGNLTLNAGATTVMQIDGPTLGTQYDHIDVSGTATLAGTLDLQFSYVPAAGSINLINAGSFVLAGDPVNGFNTITDNLSTNLGAALRVTPVITATEYDILIRQLSFLAAPGSNLTSNQTRVATALDSLATSGNGPTLIGALDMLPAGELPGAYDSLSGVQHTYTLPQVARVGRQFMHVLGDRLSWEGAAPNTATNCFDNVKLAYNGENIVSLFGTPVGTKPDSNLWLRAMGGFGDIDGDGNASGADYNSHGLALGYDREVRDGLMAGVALGFTRSNVDMNAGGTDIDSYQLAAYGRKQWDNNYLDATLGIGHHRADTTRKVQFDGFSEVAKADYDLDGVGLSLEAGRHYALSANSKVTPFAGLEYGYFRQNGFKESGAGDADLTFNDDSMDSLRSALGARLNGTLTATGGTRRIDATLGLAWVHEFMDTEASLNPAFAVNDGVPFTIKGPVADRDSALVTLGASARLSKTAQLDLDYSGEFAESDRQQLISATFRMKW